MDGGFITDFRWTFLFTQSLMNLEFSQIFLFIGVNLRLELPVLNTKIRKSYLEWGNLFSSYSIGGLHTFLGYPTQNLGSSFKSYADFFLGRTSFFKQLFGLTYKANWFLVNYNRIFNLKRLSIFLGFALVRLGIKNLILFFYESLQYFKSLAFSAINDYLGRLSLFELFALSTVDFVAENSKNYFIYNCCEISNWYANDFSVYQGSFDVGLKKIDLCLPIMFPIETKNLYLNLEGRYRETKSIIRVPRGIYAEVEVFQLFSWFKKRISISQNFSVLVNFYKSMELFVELINYKCSFFFNLFGLLARRAFFLSLHVNEVFCKTQLFIKFSNLRLICSIFSRKITNYYVITSLIPSSRILAMCALKSWEKW